MDANKINQIIADINGRAIIVGATKTQSPQDINKLPDFNILIAGENRVQEMLAKYDSVKGLEWHFIGQLQTNKVKYIIDKVSLIHSLDRISLADEIQKQSKKLNKVTNVLIELNLGEKNKGGVSEHNLEEFLSYVNSLSNVKIKGLMCMPKLNSEKSTYQKVANIFNTLKNQYNFEYLSMGTSDDYMMAIECGANMVRLGSIIFGKRDKGVANEV